MSEELNLPTASTTVCKMIRMETYRPYVDKAAHDLLPLEITKSEVGFTTSPVGVPTPGA